MSFHLTKRLLRCKTEFYHSIALRCVHTVSHHMTVLWFQTDVQWLVVSFIHMCDVIQQFSNSQLFGASKGGNEVTTINTSWRLCGFLKINGFLDSVCLQQLLLIVENLAVLLMLCAVIFTNKPKSQLQWIVSSHCILESKRVCQLFLSLFFLFVVMLNF